MTFIIEHLVWFISLSLLIIVVLGYYALSLMLKVKKQEQAKSNAINDRADNINQSIKTICDATLQQQCSISEATVRVISLLEVHPILAGKYDEKLPKTNQFFKDIEHHPILANRKKTPKHVVRKLDLEREDLEAKYESKILAELEWLSQQF